MLPFPGAVVRTFYKQRGVYWSLDKKNGKGIHTGVDFPAAEGTPIVACQGGKVVTVDYSASYGYRVGIELIVDGERVRDYYCHQPKGAIKVAVGQTVRTGQRIGSVGKTGNVTGPHLHLERRVSPYLFALAYFRDPTPALIVEPDIEPGEEEPPVTRRKPAEYDWSKLRFDETWLTKHYTTAVVQECQVHRRPPHDDRGQG